MVLRLLSFRSSRSELGRDVDEEIATQRVVDLRIRVAVSERRAGDRGTDDRRVLVEDVVHAGIQREVLVDVPRQRQVEVVLRTRACCIAGSSLSRAPDWSLLASTLTEPKYRQVNATAVSVPRRIPGAAELVAPYRDRIAADGAEVTGAIGDPAPDVELVERVDVGADQRSRRRCPSPGSAGSSSP